MVALFSFEAGHHNALRKCLTCVFELEGWYWGGPKTAVAAEETERRWGEINKLGENSLGLCGGASDA